MASEEYRHLEWAHPLVRDWFVARFGTPTEPQVEGWPHIMAGKTTLISAPTGSGKTTISKKLAQESDLRSVHLHTDDFYHFIIKDRIEPFLPEAHTQNITVIKVISEAACIYAEGGYFVIVDGIVGDWFLEPFQKACLSRSIPLYYIKAINKYYS